MPKIAVLQQAGVFRVFQLVEISPYSFFGFSRSELNTNRMLTLVQIFKEKKS
jgi:hypothetical protein